MVEVVVERLTKPLSNTRYYLTYNVSLTLFRHRAMI